MGQNTQITITVDTEKINSNNKKQCVVFSDDRDDPPQAPGKPEDYVSSVSKNMKVTWVGKSENGQDTVEIHEVSRKSKDGGSKILEKSKNTSNNGTVEAKVKDEDVSGYELYDVKFRINGEKEFTIDPKLMMVN